MTAAGTAPLLTWLIILGYHTLYILTAGLRQLFTENMYEKAPENIAELFDPFSPQIKELGQEIRKRILEALPEAAENIYGGKKVGNVLYSVGGTNKVICGMQPREKFVRVFFHNWERLKEAGYRVEGSGKNARHVKVVSLWGLNDLNLKGMIDLVKNKCSRKKS